MATSAYTPVIQPVSGASIEDVYHTPDGYWDEPFIYTYSGGSLVNGNSYYSLQKMMDGDGDFILRYIFGFRSVLASPSAGVGSAQTFGKFRYRTSWGQYVSSAPFIMAAFANAVIAPTVQPANILPSLREPDTWQVIPERKYPYNGSIVFDLLNTYVNQTALGPSGYQTGPPVLGFAGVKRRGMSYCPYDTLYKYREVPFAYDETITISNNAGSGFTTYWFRVTDFDFELQRILIEQSTGATPVQWLNGFSVVIYNAAGVPLMSNPVPWGYLVDNGLGAGGSGVSLNNATGMVFPCPPLVYRINSVIRMDVYSNWQAGNTVALPVTFDMALSGVQRIPCR